MTGMLTGIVGKTSPHGSLCVNLISMDQHIPPSQKGQPSPPAEKAVTVSVRLPPELVSALDRFARNGDLSRPQALRAAFHDWAIAHGYVQSEDEGKRPDELDASNDD